MAQRLNQILAVEKTVKNRNETEFTKIFQEVQKVDLVNGFSKTYASRDADGENFPPENKRVQVRVDEKIGRVKDALTELFDITATKDATNTIAKADIVVDGTTIATGVPATTSSRSSRSSPPCRRTRSGPSTRRRASTPPSRPSRSRARR